MLVFFGFFLRPPGPRVDPPSVFFTLLARCHPLPPLAFRVPPPFQPAPSFAKLTLFNRVTRIQEEERFMAWNKPVIREIECGMEINMYGPEHDDGVLF